MKYDDLIIKQANVSSILEQVKDQFDFKNRPFETIFSTLGTGYAFKFGWIIGMLVTASELMGFGPGYIGKLIDDYFKRNGSTSIDEMNLSQSNSEGAAQSVTDTILKTFQDLPSKLSFWTKSVFSSTITDIKKIKGNLNDNDIRSAFYVSLYGNSIIKIAKPNISKFMSFWKSSTKGTIISGLLMKLIWIFLKGMGALGIGAGVAGFMGWKTHRTEHKEDKPVKPTIGPNMKHYNNVNKNVKDTLISFLNATIANFSVGFMRSQRLANPDKLPISLENAPGWSLLEKYIAKLNWAPIEVVNNLESFVAPNVQQVAKFLLKSVKVDGIKIDKIEPKKPLSKMPKPNIKSNVKPNDEERLRKLLQGEARI